MIKPRQDQRQGTPRRISIDEQPWPSPSQQDKQIFQAVYDCLTSAFEKHPDFDIQVVQAPSTPPDEKAPMTLYRGDKPPDKPTVIRLDIEKLAAYSQTIYQFSLAAYSQTIYQFSHELCHMLTNYERSRDQRLFKWFEEAICETASIFVLRSIYRSHEFPDNDATYLESYAKDTMAKYKVDNVADWFRNNRAAMEANSCAEQGKRIWHYLVHCACSESLRFDDISRGNWRHRRLQTYGKGHMRLPCCAEDKNGIRLCNRVSWKLIPIFLESPSLWMECGSLGLWDVHGDECFENYVKSWETQIHNSYGRPARLPQIVKDLLKLTPT